MKKCPFCQEEIQDSAIKCRFCGEFLQDEKKEEENSKPKINQKKTQEKNIKYNNISDISIKKVRNLSWLMIIVGGLYILLMSLGSILAGNILISITAGLYGTSLIINGVFIFKNKNNNLYSPIKTLILCFLWLTILSFLLSDYSEGPKMIWYPGLIFIYLSGLYLRDKIWKQIKDNPNKILITKKYLYLIPVLGSIYYFSLLYV